MKLKKQDSAYPLLATLKRLGRPLTRENYLALDGWDSPEPNLRAEEELDLPPQFRRSSRPPKEALIKKPEVTPDVPELTPEDKKREVTVTYTRRVLTPVQQTAHDWKLDNWLRCRCECDDHFDMCLNCITHRQLTDLVQ
jgi:hypothetical protein